MHCAFRMECVSTSLGILERTCVDIRLKRLDSIRCKIRWSEDGVIFDVVIWFFLENMYNKNVRINATNKAGAETMTLKERAINFNSEIENEK